LVLEEIILDKTLKAQTKVKKDKWDMKLRSLFTAKEITE
jgi:hypothetical protein